MLLLRVVQFNTSHDFDKPHHHESTMTESIMTELRSQSSLLGHLEVKYLN